MFNLWIVDQHSHRRRFQIVELPTTDAAYTGYQGGTAERERERQRHIQYAHVSLSASKLLTIKVAVSTLSELSGIKIAASKGVIQPVIAKPTATKL